MNVLRAGRLLLCPRSSAAFVSPVPILRSGHLDRDWMPGPPPRTEEERLAAAKKYNLLPEEYEFYSPDNAKSFGDFPRLPTITFEQRDPYYPWTYPAHRANWNETPHVFALMYGFDRLEYSDNPHGVTGFEAFVKLFGFMLIYYLTYMQCMKVPRLIPAKPKHMPHQGITHYHYPPMKDKTKCAIYIN